MAIKEMYRIIKPKGLLLLTTPSKEWLVKNGETDLTQRGYTDKTIAEVVNKYFNILKKEYKMGQFLLKLQKIAVY